MPNIIIQRNGAWNIYSTVVDAPLFESALTEKELEEYIQQELGQVGMMQLPSRMGRALAKGTSAHISKSLECEIQGNRSGSNESCLSFDDFVAKFLTLKN